MTAGIVAWGAYVPYYRLERKAIGATLGTPAGRGTRSVASYDEDTTSMGVEAARVALARAGLPTPGGLFFSTPEPAYLDKTNATAIHAALGLPQSTGAYDMCGSVRSAWAAMEAGAVVGSYEPTLVVLSDVRTGLPGGADERESGDGAAAFLYAADGAVAEPIVRRSPPRSSWTAGGFRARTPATCGRSGSASRSTSRWPKPPSPTR
jgi:hydroxymethylglutaryl-CoA synthase